MGISPLVRMIERQRALPIGTRLPRWLAILVIYAARHRRHRRGVGMVVIPPLVEQAEELWRTLPEQHRPRRSRWLLRFGILREPITLGDAVQQTPASGGATAVSARSSARCATCSAACSASSPSCC